MGRNALIGDGLTVDREHAIARRAILRAPPALPAGAACNDRGGIPGGQIEAQSGQQFAGLGQRAPIRGHAQSHATLDAVAAHAQRNHALIR